MDPDLQSLVLAPVVAGRRILLGRNSRLLFLSELVLGSLTKRLDSVDSAWHSPNLSRDLTTPDQTDYNAGTDNESQNEPVLSVCDSSEISNHELNDLDSGTYTKGVSSLSKQHGCR